MRFLFAVLLLAGLVVGSAGQAAVTIELGGQAASGQPTVTEVEVNTSPSPNTEEEQDSVAPAETGTSTPLDKEDGELPAGVSATVDGGITARGQAVRSAAAALSERGELLRGLLREHAELAVPSEAAQIAAQIAAQVQTGQDLAEYVRSIVLVDEQVREVTVRETEVSVTYPQPAKLFGFISISLPVRVIAATDGAVDVDYPWYRFVTRTASKPLTTAVQTAATEIAETDWFKETDMQLGVRLLLAVTSTLRIQNEIASQSEQAN